MLFKPQSKFELLQTILAAAFVLLALIAMLWFATRPAAAAEPAEQVLDPKIAAKYIGPTERIDIGGRVLNLNCMGSGERTVLFESGGSDWSVIWALVQPETAKHFRACSYDRAGLGYSDPSPFPRTPGAIVEDMKALVEAAKLPKPFILVGHSIGGFNAKLYNAFYPDDVAALVLVDPSEDRQAARSRAYLTSKHGMLLTARAELTDITFIGFLMERYRTCARLAADGPLDPASLAYRRCSDPVRPKLGTEIAAERQKIQVSQNYQKAQASEVLNSVYGDAQANVTYERLFKKGAFGSKPMIVLTHVDADMSDPLDILSQEMMIELHRETARLSRNGIQRPVERSSHNIEIDRPMTIVDAIDEVSKAIDSKAHGKRP